ncbi:DNA-binding MarR family transcriptional regulator/N-acetylglutamate synthase-like GNAT family acetyltransferase [Flavobacterium nitrogenifigens]|uniref:DNA-binding MarR family transcriptional regulator/N-acetylglutamate synthase-like GNAT family acetyltransferase n=2 Tax=Flavobacterium TaxID=237 RepID=A0A7W7J2P6_9FLAO|nr:MULTISPECIES: bifunctional helix-turn-helix transcriptional regulator/GNAT family N-acetyltransferase [Flavobacterium]MBB4804672.1 DNA-binding MarR family transcriptional regulator/N-acetylglutamate synthase-like GNAT family acetyltransferase [Flavobacterium nitrogenifigens]MBB6389631.1 DNA-binding MarR family transcriptional regulator/N-acetylglutamate synthase-like GNAT family acetyltransferase [Flavobacterium notoginsengisoli]
MKTATSKIRSFNRFYTAHLDLLNQHYLESNYSLTEVRILYEISESKIITAQKITEILKLDKGYLSRILKRFLKENLITRISSEEDKRAFNIKLSDYGNELLNTLNAKSEKKIEDKIEKLNFTEKEMLVSSMQKIKNLMTENKIERHEISYRHTINPGDIGYIIYLHGYIYGNESNFSTDFEKYVIKTFYHFLENYSPEKDRIWMAEYNNKIVGCIAIQHQLQNEAQLRWFLLDPAFRGLGIGKKLLTDAVDFCREKKFENVFLLTTSLQNKALEMYKLAGFKLTKSEEVQEWGKVFNEERYDLKLK